MNKRNSRVYIIRKTLSDPELQELNLHTRTGHRTGHSSQLNSHSQPLPYLCLTSIWPLAWHPCVTWCIVRNTFAVHFHSTDWYRSRHHRHYTSQHESTLLRKSQRHGVPREESTNMIDCWGRKRTYVAHGHSVRAHSFAVFGRLSYTLLQILSHLPQNPQDTIPSHPCWDGWAQKNSACGKTGFFYGT